MKQMSFAFTICIKKQITKKSSKFQTPLNFSISTLAQFPNTVENRTCAKCISESVAEVALPFYAHRCLWQCSYAPGPYRDYPDYSWPARDLHKSSTLPKYVPCLLTSFKFYFIYTSKNSWKWLITSALLYFTTTG